MPVGWNWKNSMSSSGKPRRRMMPGPSPVNACAFDVTLISNEVGEGVHPPTEDGLRFRDLLGMVNQRLAAACERVVLMVAGLPLTLKAPTPYANPVQAP